MYTKPAPVFSSSRKSKKEEKSRKTDDKSTSSTKKPKETKETNKSPAKATPKKNEKPLNNAKTNEKSAKSTKSVKSTKSQKTTTRATAAAVEVPTKSPATMKPTQSPVVERTRERLSAIIVPVIRPQLVNNRIIETREANEIPSAIKFRVSYGKDTPNRSNSFKIPTTPNTSRISDGGCANCSKHSRNVDKLNESVSTLSSCEMPVAANHNQEEFYKYLGIDTNPPHEKLSPEPSPTDANALYNNRRSLRVFIQQKQNEFTRANEKSPRDDRSPDKSRMKSPIGKSHSSNGESPNGPQWQTPENGKKRDEQMLNGAIKPISSHIKQRHSYEPPSSSDGDGFRPNNVPDGPNNNLSRKETETECDAHVQQNATDSSSNRVDDGSGPSKVTARVPKRKIVLPSPMMLTKMFERYKQCFKQGFAMRQGFVKKRPKRTSNTNNPQPKVTSTQVQTTEKPVETNGELSTDDIQPIINTCEELINTFSPTSITHSNASTDSAIVVNSNVNDTLQQPKITLTQSDSLQWQQDQANHIDKSTFRNPLDPKYGAVLAVLTHSVSPNNDDVVVVIQQSQISYWYSTSKVLSMFGVARSWIKIGDVQRFEEGEVLIVRLD